MPPTKCHILWKRGKLLGLGPGVTCGDTEEALNVTPEGGGAQGGGPRAGEHHWPEEGVRSRLDRLCGAAGLLWHRGPCDRAPDSSTSQVLAARCPPAHAGLRWRPPAG